MSAPTAPLGTRRLPLHRRIRRSIAVWFRSTRPARRLAAVLTPPGWDGTRTMHFRPGRYFADDDARNLPIVVVVATGLQPGDAERLAREFERAQLLAGSFRPLFVIDTGEFAPFRSRGYVVERVMRRDELAAANPRDSYGEYLFSRLQSIAHDYGAASIVPLPAGDPGALSGPLTRLVGAIDPPPRAA